MARSKDVRYILKTWNDHWIKANEPTATVYHSEALLADHYTSLAKAKEAAKRWKDVKVVKLTLEEMT